VGRTSQAYPAVTDIKVRVTDLRLCYLADKHESDRQGKPRNVSEKNPASKGGTATRTLASHSTTGRPRGQERVLEICTHLWPGGIPSNMLRKDRNKKIAAEFESRKEKVPSERTIRRALA
jgi:hypothetical protein